MSYVSEIIELLHYFIINIRNQDLGCYVNRFLVSCILYANDMIQLSASLSALQEMLNIVSLTAKELLLDFNVDKSHCIAFGLNVSNLPSLHIGSETLK